MTKLWQKWIKNIDWKFVHVYVPQYAACPLLFKLMSILIFDINVYTV